ncbi:type IV pilin protein [Candidatus Omnitrophota bacterium]
MISRLNKRKGFTLLELMIVVIIVGILASLALPRFIRARDTARSAEALNNLGLLRGSQIRYFVANDAYSGNLALLDVDDPSIVINAMFAYTCDGATGTCRATYNIDNSRDITMTIDGVISRNGF